MPSSFVRRIRTMISAEHHYTLTPGIIQASLKRARALPHSVEFLVEPLRERRPVNAPEAALAARLAPAERAVADLYLAELLAIRKNFKLNAAPGLREFEHTDVDLDLVFFFRRHLASFQPTN